MILIVASYGTNSNDLFHSSNKFDVQSENIAGKGWKGRRGEQGAKKNNWGRGERQREIE